MNASARRMSALFPLLLLACIAPQIGGVPPLPPDARPGDPRGLSAHPSVGSLVVDNRTGWDVEILLRRGGVNRPLGFVERESQQTFQPLPTNERVSFLAVIVGDTRYTQSDMVLRPGYPRHWVLREGSGWTRYEVASPD